MALRNGARTYTSNFETCDAAGGKFKDMIVAILHKKVTPQLARNDFPARLRARSPRPAGFTVEPQLLVSLIGPVTATFLIFRMPRPEWNKLRL